MDKEWSEKNKEIQRLLGKNATYKDGIRALIGFRSVMFEQISQIVNTYPKEAFAKVPFLGANGYHSKTLGYSIWHIFRIEDIVAHELIAEDKQILFSYGYDKSIGSPIITTGNEIRDEELADFSEKLDITELYHYAQSVMNATNEILERLDYPDFKRTFGEESRQKLINSGCVSADEKASWLVDYWCGKNVLGLIRMPFSRHWIMHIEAMRRIANKLCKQASKISEPKS